jgi:hypothetical protein
MRGIIEGPITNALDPADTSGEEIRGASSVCFSV